MYLAPEEKVKRARGFALGIAGSFVFILSSALILELFHQPLYLILGGLSLGSVLLIYFASKSLALWSQVLYLISASVAFAAEVSVVVLYTPEIEAVGYALASLAGSFISLKGIGDMESLLASPSYPRKRREIPAVNEGA